MVKMVGIKHTAGVQRDPEQRVDQQQRGLQRYRAERGDGQRRPVNPRRVAEPGDRRRGRPGERGGRGRRGLYGVSIVDGKARVGAKGWRKSKVGRRKGAGQ